MTYKSGDGTVPFIFTIDFSKYSPDGSYKKCEKKQYEDPSEEDPDYHAEMWKIEKDIDSDTSCNINDNCVSADSHDTAESAAPEECEYAGMDGNEKGIICRYSDCFKRDSNPFTMDGPPFNFKKNGKFAMPIRIQHVKGEKILYDLDCDNDGTFEFTGLKDDHICTYDKSGPHQIAVRGTLPGLYLGDESSAEEDNNKKLPSKKRKPAYMGHILVSVDQWGNIAWKTMNRMFKRCRWAVIKTADTPYLKDVTDMSEMFYAAQSFNQPINTWDVSNVVRIKSMFELANSFNQPLDRWNTSKVIDMSRMFRYAEVFNQPIGTWNTANVTDMSGMFSAAQSFNQSVENWNTSKVKDMNAMFSGAASFNQPLDKWDVSNVTNMSRMFYLAGNFSQPLGKWNTKSAADMSNMFEFARNFDQPIGTWNTSNAANMKSMFKNSGFNSPIETWNVSKVKDMSEMFYEAQSFNQPLSGWDVSNVTDMSDMFHGASEFNQPLNTWNVSKVKDMSEMFSYAENFSQPVKSWSWKQYTE